MIQCHTNESGSLSTTRGKAATLNFEGCVCPIKTSQTGLGNETQKVLLVTHYILDTYHELQR